MLISASNACDAVGRASTFGSKTAYTNASGFSLRSFSALANAERIAFNLSLISSLSLSLASTASKSLISPFKDSTFFSASDFFSASNFSYSFSALASSSFSLAKVSSVVGVSVFSSNTEGAAGVSSAGLASFALAASNFLRVSLYSSVSLLICSV